MKRFKVSFFTYNLMYALWTLGVFNWYFLGQVFDTVPGYVFPLIIFVILIGLMFIQSLIFRPKTVKPLSIFFLISNALAGYFISSFHLVLNKTMLANLFDTNFFEATEWMGFSFWLYVIGFGVIPSLLVMMISIQFEPVGKHYVAVLKMLGGMVLIGVLCLPFKMDIKMYLKTNFNLRYQLVPTGYVSGFVGAIFNRFKQVEGIDTLAGMVRHPYAKNSKKNLFVFVLGESARDANFSLSGYDRDTAAPLKKYAKDLIVFKNTESCGVVTRVSLPCMFGPFTRHNYSEPAMVATTNVLDILTKNNIDVLWFDNEMGCNKVCRNIPTEYTCTTRSCTDMLLNNRFREKMSELTAQDTMVIVHQRGSHGPRYDMRIPDEFQKWKPYCDKSDSQHCSYQELVNAYDNSIYYTSFVVADMIETLSHLTNEYNPVLLYISDHGESLGEQGAFGHGGDFKDAPDYQKHVPFFIWMPESTRQAFGFNKICLKDKTAKETTQDAIFHSLLGWAGIRTNVYDERLDIFAGCHR